jgi:hypothetical protein
MPVCCRVQGALQLRLVLVALVVPAGGDELLLHVKDGLLEEGRQLQGPLAGRACRDGLAEHVAASVIINWLFGVWSGGGFSTKHARIQVAGAKRGQET